MDAKTKKRLKVEVINAAHSGVLTFMSGTRGAALLGQTSRTQAIDDNSFFVVSDGGKGGTPTYFLVKISEQVS